MRRLILVAVVLMANLSRAQTLEPLIFREKIYDFGEIQESRGNADHEFVFTNNAGRPVKILNVAASCGCTTPGWSKDAVAVGKTGFIKASFDPKGRPGYFNKTLTVLTDLDPNPMVLLTALLCGCGMGVLGGFFPAIRAARVAPIEALRS